MSPCARGPLPARCGGWRDPRACNRSVGFHLSQATTKVGALVCVGRDLDATTEDVGEVVPALQALVEAIETFEELGQIARLLGCLREGCRRADVVFELLFRDAREALEQLANDLGVEGRTGALLQRIGVGPEPLVVFFEAGEALELVAEDLVVGRLFECTQESVAGIDRLLAAFFVDPRDGLKGATAIVVILFAGEAHFEDGHEIVVTAGRAQHRLEDLGGDVAEGVVLFADGSDGGDGAFVVVLLVEDLAVDLEGAARIFELARLQGGDALAQIDALGGVVDGGGTETHGLHELGPHLFRFVQALQRADRFAIAGANGERGLQRRDGLARILVPVSARRARRTSRS